MPQLPDVHIELDAANTSYTPFRLTEKHFKSHHLKDVYPTLRSHEVLDLSRPPGPQEADEVWRAGWWGPTPEEVGGKFGERLRAGKGWKGKERERGERPELSVGNAKRIQLEDGRIGYIVAEGCILIPRYLPTETQLDLLESALAEYTVPPNPLSLDTHYNLPQNLYQLYASSSTELIHPKHDTSLSNRSEHRYEAPPEKPKSTRVLIDTPPASALGYEEIVARNRTFKGDTPSEKLGSKTAEALMRELRWANLGWVYQWSTKSYDFTPDVPIAFPQGLRDICTAAVRSIPWREVFPHTASGSEKYGDSTVEEEEYLRWGQDYEPDTGIVNFYQMNDTLMGHVDRAELDPSRPLVSISLGHACIFLLGTSTRSIAPQPMILRSGDVLIMSGKGRQGYHGVPRIMEGTLPDHFVGPTQLGEGIEALKRKSALKWIQTARININARQVFPPGFERPSLS